MPACSVSGEDSFPGSSTALFLLWPHRAEEQRAFWGPFYKGTSPLPEGSTSWSNKPPKAPNPSHWGVRFQHMRLGETEIFGLLSWPPTPSERAACAPYASVQEARPSQVHTSTFSLVAVPGNVTTALFFFSEWVNATLVCDWEWKKQQRKTGIGKSSFSSRFHLCGDF